MPNNINILDEFVRAMNHEDIITISDYGLRGVRSVVTEAEMQLRQQQQRLEELMRANNYVVGSVDWYIPNTPTPRGTGSQNNFQDLADDEDIISYDEFLAKA